MKLDKITLPKSVLTKEQKIEIKRDWPDSSSQLTISIRFDDSCNNGHNTFAITGNNLATRSFGCIHDDIALVAPELKKYFKWHLCSTDGPMHYIANTVYHASDKDCWGKRKGEPKSYETRLFFDSVPIPHKLKSERFVQFIKNAKNYDFSIIELPYIAKGKETYKFDSKYTFKGYGSEWYHGPFDNLLEAENFLKALQNCKVAFIEICTAWGEGKERDIDAARNAAIWPEATYDDLTSINLEEKLMERLPALMKEFKNDMESLGFKY